MGGEETQGQEEEEKEEEEGQEEEEEAGEEGRQEAGEEGEEGEETQGQEEEEKEEEEDKEAPVPGRPPREARPEEQEVVRCQQEDRGGAEEEGRWPLQAGVGLSGPLGDHGHQGQDDPRPGVQGGLGAHQEEGPEQGPQRRQDRRDLRRRLDVQAPGRREQAHQVSECVFLSPVIS